MYGFRRLPASWFEFVRHAAAGGAPGDLLGVALAFDADTFVAGAPGVDVAGQSDAGAAYGFRTPQAPVLYCTGKTNSKGCVPFLTVEGVPSTSAPIPFRILAHDVVDGEFGFLLYGAKRANLDYHGGVLCVKAPVSRLLPPKLAKALGTPPCRGLLKRDFGRHVQGGSDPTLTAGRTVTAQWIQRDPSEPTGFGDSLSSAVRFTICP